MDLKYLKTFKTIIEQGSFANAAAELNYTQSTVTFQMQQLEQDLATKLFEKIGRRMVVTEGGLALLPYIDTILQAVEQLENHGKSLSQLSGSLSVVAPESLLTYQLQPLLAAFRAQAPAVRLSVQALNCYVIRDRLINGGSDIAIHYDVGGYSPTVTTQQLHEFHLALVASPLIDPAQVDFIAPEQRKPLCLITADKNSIYQELIVSYLKQRRIVLEGYMELGSLEAIKRSVISNLGVAYLPRFAVEDELRSGAMLELATAQPEQTISAICAYNKNKWISPAMELFMRLLAENAWV